MYRSCNCARRTTHNRSGFIYLGMGFLSFINWIGALGFKGDLVYKKVKRCILTFVIYFVSTTKPSDIFSATNFHLGGNLEYLSDV